MGELVSYPLTLIAWLLAIPVMFFLLEIVAAIAPSRSQDSSKLAPDVRPPLAVLIPAHNESAGIAQTLSNIQKQLLAHDRLLVVADNCSDDTASVSKAAGADVVERTNPAKRGKGYALDWGIRHLSSSPTEIVIIVDADCRLKDGAIDRLALACKTTGRPVQALYLMAAPAGSQINYQVAEFSWRVKNWLRPLGLLRLNLPCQLMGTGMAFPQDILREAKLESGHIVEDLKLGLDLALAGHPPVFCPSACVTSEFASSVQGAKTQRARWEHGHLDMIVKTAPTLFLTALIRRSFQLLAVALDLIIPPLSLLGILIAGVFGLSILAAITRFSFAPLVVSTANVLLLTTAVLLAWLKCGRDIVPASTLLLIPSYAFRKLNLYHQFLLRKIDTQWIRTDRSE